MSCPPVQPEKIAILVRQLLEQPKVHKHFPRLSGEIHKARLGQPSPAMHRILLQLNRLDVVGKPRKRLGIGLAPIRPGTRLAVMKDRDCPVLPSRLTEDVHCCTVTAVELYPLDPDAEAHQDAVHVQDGPALSWATIVAVVSPSGSEPLRWDYIMEHETDTSAEHA